MSVVSPSRIESFQAVRSSSVTSGDEFSWEVQEDKIQEDSSRAISPDGQEIKQDLNSLFREHSTDNWDGYGAKPVTPESFFAAINFLRMLPTTVPRPELSVDPDGRIVFEWYRRPRRVFSVAVEKDNQLTYAGLFDSSKVSGTDYLDYNLPQIIFPHIQRVLS